MYVTEIDESTVCKEPSNSSLPLVLSCGHLCLMCLQFHNIDTSILASDHQYSKNISSKPNVATKSIGTNTDELMFASLNQQTVNNLVTTAPIKQQLHHSNEQNSIFDNDSFKDDSKDTEDENDFEENIVSQRKFIVFEDQLDQLLTRLI